MKTTRPAAKKTAKKTAAVELPRWARGDVPKATRADVIRRDGAVCVYCGASEDTMTVDHIIPQKTMIDHRPSNLVCACSECNNDRSVIDCDLFCIHVSRRTKEDPKKIYARVLRQTAKKV